MKSLVAASLVLSVAVGVVAGAVAQEDSATPKIANSQPFIQVLCKHLSSTNPRVRYTVREALRNFASQGIASIREAKEAAQDPNVKAFIDRVIRRVKFYGLRPSKKMDAAARKTYFSAMKNQPKFDIDRIAMDINLTFAQMAKLEPRLKHHFSDVDAMWREVKEMGATGDKEAYKALNEEIALLVDNAEPKLRKFLDDKQTEHVLRLMRRRYGGGWGMSQQRITSLRDQEMMLKDKARALEAKLERVRAMEAQKRADEEAARRQRERGK